VSLTISLVRNSKGEVIGASTIARDITERKRAQERLKHYAQDLKESNEDLENFAFVASHDLQEPLRIVASYIQMFAKRYKESTDANVNKYITYIVDNVGRMQEMINGLLEYSRIGKKNQTYHRLEASRACDRAISNLELAINKKLASVTRDELPMVWGNETEWTQVFQNLIGNAIKYCDKKPLIHIGVKDDADYWTFFIKDNGIGIEKQYCEQIFDVFKRLHTKAEYPGTGIGLSICKKIVEKNGGQVWVESIPGEGSTFFFTMSKSEKNERSLR
jgi:light-regulated signal transduction histidine kinase (bacteriophytochrome)